MHIILFYAYEKQCKNLQNINIRFEFLKLYGCYQTNDYC